MPGSWTTVIVSIAGSALILAAMWLIHLARRGRGLTEQQRSVLGRAVDDAVTYRDPGGGCADCLPGQPCAVHEEDRVRADSYYRTALALGLDLDQPDPGAVRQTGQ